jgi:hypothetical protein
MIARPRRNERSPQRRSATIVLTYRLLFILLAGGYSGLHGSEAKGCRRCIRHLWRDHIWWFKLTTPLSWPLIRSASGHGRPYFENSGRRQERAFNLVGRDLLLRFLLTKLFAESRLMEELLQRSPNSNRQSSWSMVGLENVRGHSLCLSRRWAKLDLELQNYIKKDIYDVVKPHWIKDSIALGQLAPLRKK